MLLELKFKDDEITFTECKQVYLKSDCLVYVFNDELTDVKLDYLEYAKVNNEFVYEYEKQK